MNVIICSPPVRCAVYFNKHFFNHEKNERDEKHEKFERDEKDEKYFRPQTSDLIAHPSSLSIGYILMLIALGIFLRITHSTLLQEFPVSITLTVHAFHHQLLLKRNGNCLDGSFRLSYRCGYFLLSSCGILMHDAQHCHLF